jgi:hypothetical protein
LCNAYLVQVGAEVFEFQGIQGDGVRGELPALAFNQKTVDDIPDGTPDNLLKQWVYAGCGHKK